MMQRQYAYREMDGAERGSARGHRLIDQDGEAENNRRRGRILIDAR
jgi:hypothetical protein